MLKWGETGHEPLWARMWLYGPPGSGKTVAAACWPAPFFVFCHNEDSKTTLRPMGSFRHVEVGVPRPDQPHTAVVPVREDVENLCNALLESNARGALHQEFGQTLVIDSTTHLNDLVITELEYRSKHKQMSKPEWGRLQRFYLHLRDALWRLPMHVIFTSFAQVKTDSSNNVISGGPYVQGSASDLLPGSCSALGFCDTDLVSGQRLVWFKKKGSYPARHRYPPAPEGPIPNDQLWATFAPALGWAA